MVRQLLAARLQELWFLKIGISKHLQIARQAKHCLALRLHRGVVGEVVRGGGGERGEVIVFGQLIGLTSIS